MDVLYRDFQDGVAGILKISYIPMRSGFFKNLHLPMRVVLLIRHPKSETSPPSPTETDLKL
jgi:hypothetical protein